MIALAYTLLAVQLAMTALLLVRRFRPALFCRLLTNSTLLKEGRWDDCDGEPLNAAALEWDRRDGVLI